MLSLPTTFVSLLALVQTITAVPTSRNVYRSNEDSFKTFSNVTVYTPPASYNIPRTLYARSILLNAVHEHEKIILSTWENYGPEKPYFPIHQSNDGGLTWHEISRVTDQVNGWGMRYQPFLYELPEDVGQFKAGTILCAGNSIPEDLSLTQIDIYASTDKGYTWKFVSHIASGGRAVPDNGLTPVWEPFLMVWKGQLVVYYSDQRDPLHGQKLVHQTSKDLITWNAPVDDFADPVYNSRPGMPTIAKLHRGQYIMTYEYYGASEADFAVYYRISDDPTKFASKIGHVIRSKDGTVPVSSPYVVFTPEGGRHGTIAVSSGTNSEIFVNYESGDPDSWIKIPTSEGISYTRALMVMPNKSNLMIIGGGILGGQQNSVTATVMKLPRK